MMLTGFTLYRYTLPFTQAVVFRGIEVQRRTGCLLKLEAEDGIVGWGEVAPLPGFSTESLEEAVTQLSQLKPWMMGRPVMPEWLDLHGEPALALDRKRLVPSVRFGLELAVWNVLAGQRKLPLPDLLGNTPGRTVALNGLLMGQEEDVVNEAVRMRKAGYQAIKLKVGRHTLEEDIRRVRRVSDVLGPDVQLRLDANRAWSLETATTFVRAIAGLPACVYRRTPC